MPSDRLSLQRKMAAFGERPYFLEALSGSGRGPGIGTCDQAEMSE